MDWGGPPYAWSALLVEAPAGVHQFLLASGDPARPFACAEVRVRTERAGDADPPIATGAWPVERAWSREMENLYSAWVARLFLIDAGAKAGWRPLHQVLRDPKRNLLWGYLGLGEDNVQSKTKVYLTPDCADAPSSCARTSPGRCACLSPCASACAATRSTARCARPRRSPTSRPNGTT